MTQGFKEWSLVCEAMGSGRQSIILRKGGISEEDGRFAFKHREFYLIPSHFHEQTDKLTFTEKAPISLPFDPAQVQIVFFVKVLATRILRDWKQVKALAPFHVWKEEVVWDRFQWDEANAIHLALIRVYRLCHPWILPPGTEFSGCKSWFDLPSSPGINMSPVLDEASHQAKVLALESVLNESSVGPNSFRN